MKKVILLVLVLVTILSSNAQVFVENFETATANSNLEGYNNWYVSAKAEDAHGISPKIAEGALFYTGYAGSNIGNVAVLDSAIGVIDKSTGPQGQRISTKIIKFGNDTLKAIVGQKIYCAFLINFSTHSIRSYRDFFTFEGSKSSSSTRGRIFAKLNTTGDIVSLAISKNTSNSTGWVESTTLPSLTLNTGINNLLVFCYETIDGASNDKVSLYINPDLTKPEIEQTNILIPLDNTTVADYGLTSGLGINLRQRGIGAQIGGIRVGKSWDSVVLGKNTGIDNVNTTNFRISGKSIITHEPGNLRIYNLAGSEVLSAATEGRLDTNLDKGMYLIKFVDNTGKTSALKVQLN